MKHRFLYIYTAFVVSLSILVFLSFLFFQQLESMLKSNVSVENTYKSLNEIQHLNTFIITLETATRGYVLTGDSSYLLPFDNHTAIIKTIIDTLHVRVSYNENMKNKLAMLYSTIKLRLGGLYQLIDKTSNQDTTLRLEALIRSKSTMDALQNEIGEFQKEELKMLNQNSEKKRFYENITPSYLKIVLFFTCFITIASFFFLNMSLRQRLRYQRELEYKVSELHRSNEELEQLAHVASHDLQEPLRKMRTFSNRLLIKHSEGLDEEVKLILGRIEAAAVSMQDLISDVVVFTTLIHSPENICRVELDDILAQVLDEMQTEFKTNKVMFQSDRLPAIQGYSKQLGLLFKCLLENSIKFARQGIAPQIIIRVDKSIIKNHQFYCLKMEDNGVGFDNVFNKKIFVLFQRLHSEQSGYKGKGIGLAIAKRIVINHKGIIMANGKPGKGAVFEVYLPVP